MPQANRTVEQKRARKNENNRKNYWRKKYGTDPPATSGTKVATRHSRQSVEKPLMTRMPLTVKAAALQQSPGLPTGRHSQSALPSRLSTRSPQRSQKRRDRAPPDAGAVGASLHTIHDFSAIAADSNIDPFYGVSFEQLQLFYNTNGSTFFLNDSALTVLPLPSAQVSTERPRVATSLDVPAIPKGPSAHPLEIEFSPRSTDGTATLCALWRVLEKMKNKNQELSGRSRTEA
ncbi:hypothetical protein BDZ89DRAFT_1049921 [Hymenopellis radicata]|nr:hypothetical protein BDZ89DRAFT_1049921 [Hymenopellis radicata]